MIGALASHHFASVIAPNFVRVEQLLFAALRDPEETVRLHAARSLEMIGVALHSLSAGLLIPLNQKHVGMRMFLIMRHETLVKNAFKIDLQSSKTDEVDKGHDDFE